MYVAYPPNFKTEAMLQFNDAMWASSGGVRQFAFSVTRNSAYPWQSFDANVALHLGHINGAHIGSCYIQSFTNHCGMRAISGLWVRPNVKELGTPFLECIESYLWQMNYTTLIGSDGESSGNGVHNFIRHFGDGWKIVDMGINRRMGKPQSLFYKNMKEDPLSPLFKVSNFIAL